MTFKVSTGGWGRWLALLLVLPGCDYERIKHAPGKAGEPPPRLQATLESVQSVLINPRCVRCHGEPTPANRNVGLVDLRDSIEKSGHHHGPHPRWLIKPGCPKQSFFLTLLQQGKMPPRPADPIPAEELKTLEAFIVGLDPKAAKLCDDEPPDLE